MLNKEEFNSKYNEISSENKTLQDIVASIKVLMEDDRIIALSCLSELLLKQKPYLTQVNAAILLSNGRNVLEMQTGEGKTLSGIIAAANCFYKGQERVLILSANEYLAERDYLFSKPYFEALSIKSSCIKYLMNNEERQQAYLSNIVFASYEEYAKDFLSNKIARNEIDLMNVSFDRAIIDEADLSMIDRGADTFNYSIKKRINTELCKEAKRIVDFLETEDVYCKTARDIYLTNTGIFKIEDLKKIHYFEDKNFELRKYIKKALIAKFSLKKDDDYIVDNNEICLIDSLTGRIMKNFKYPDGIHQAVQCKEGIEPDMQDVLMASISFPTLFNTFPALSAMTGTVINEISEFKNVYNLDFVKVERRLPNKRIDNADVYFKTLEEKLDYLEEIIEMNAEERPILIGTESVEESEIISNSLSEKGVSHSVLNAKHHKQEAEKIKNAGNVGAITICTNMAGRGTDIVISESARNAGGLLVVGFTKKPTLRMDEQLRGRCARQGDPGETIFLFSAEDKLFLDSYKGVTGGSAQTLIGLANASKTAQNNGAKDAIESKMFSQAQAISEERIAKRKALVKKYNDLHDTLFLSFFSDQKKHFRSGASQEQLVYLENEWIDFLNKTNTLRGRLANSNATFEEYEAICLKEYNEMICNITANLGGVLA